MEGVGCKMEKNLDLLMAAKIVAFLNELLEIDRPAIAAIIANRVPCGAALADHATVQVVPQHGGFHVGMLGLLNGLCGTMKDGGGPIAALFDKPDGDNVRDVLDLIRFEVRPTNQR